MYARKRYTYIYMPLPHEICVRDSRGLSISFYVGALLETMRGQAWLKMLKLTAAFELSSSLTECQKGEAEARATFLQC